MSDCRTLWELPEGMSLDSHGVKVQGQGPRGGSPSELSSSSIPCGVIPEP